MKFFNELTTIEKCSVVLAVVLLLCLLPLPYGMHFDSSGNCYYCGMLGLSVL